MLVVSVVTDISLLFPCFSPLCKAASGALARVAEIAVLIPSRARGGGDQDDAGDDKGPERDPGRSGLVATFPAQHESNRSPGV